MRKKVGIKTVAEFISSKRDFKTCKELEIDYFQGYLFDEPKNIKKHKIIIILYKIIVTIVIAFIDICYKKIYIYLSIKNFFVNIIL